MLDFGLFRLKLLRFLDVGFLHAFLTKVNANRGLERYRRAGITASTAFLSKALTIIIGLVSVPLTVHYLGPERYGVWLTISSLLTWMALTDFGIAGNALVNAISGAYGNDNRQMAQEYAASAFWALVGISLIVGGAMGFVFPWIPWRSVFRVSEHVATGELNTACALTILVFALNMPLNIVPSVYSAYQEGFVANLWAIGSNILALVGLIAVTHFRGGLPALILATSGTRIVVTSLNAVYLFAGRYRWLSPTVFAVRWVRVKHLMNLGSKYMLTQLASLGIYQSQPFIITQILGPAYVPIFVIAYKIITVPVDLSYIATTPFLSAFSEANARADWRWIRSAFRNVTLACMAIGIPLTLAIAYAGKFLVGWLAGPQLVPDWGVIGWLSIYTLISVVLMTTGQILCGLESVGTFAFSLCITAVAMTGLGILLAHTWGLAGIAASMAIAKTFIFLPTQIFQLLHLLRRNHPLKEQTESKELVA
jgi:O-antigen/teichoic acid export membrane protein